MDKLAVTISEAVQISGIGRTNLYKLFKDGSLKPRKSGSRTLVIVDELKEYLKSLPDAR